MYLVLAFFVLVFIWLWRGFQKPKKFPPGPPKLPLVGGALHFSSKKGSLIHGIIGMTEKYGPISGVFIGSQSIIFVSEYNLIKALFKRDELSSRPPVEPLNENRPGWEMVGEENKGCNPGVIMIGGQSWREQRRFLLRNLKEFGFGKASMELAIQEEMTKLCDKLSTQPKNEPLSLHNMMNISIVNALWAILVGEKLDLDDPKLVTVLEMFDLLMKAGNNPAFNLLPLLPFPQIAKLPGLRKMFNFDKVTGYFQVMWDFIYPYIQNHEETLDPNNIRDFMDLYLLEIRKTKDTNSSFYGERGHYSLFNNMFDLFTTGMETTSGSLLWTFLFFLHHPDVQQCVHEELDQVVGRHRFPTLDDRPNLHYTNAVLQESLRVVAMAGGSVPHYTTKDVPINDYVIPKNSIVFGSLYHVMYDPEYFEDPHTFKPERFIDASGKFMENERVVPFGIGKRACLGQTLAEKEFYIFFAGLMQRFEVQKAPGHDVPSYHIDESFAAGVIRTCPDYKLLLKNRILG